MLGDDLRDALPVMRAEAESRFTEMFTFYTVTRGLDDDLQPTDIETVIASGVRGRVRSSARDSRDVEFVGQDPVVSQLVLSVAVGSVPMAARRPSVFARCTASTSDPGLAGMKYRTKDSPTMGQVTAWRYPVEQVS